MRSLFVVLGLASLLICSAASALTTPLPGAVAFPSNVKLVLPFPAGAKIKLLSGYGPSAGSSLHKDTNKPSKANDYYALDLVYDDKPNAGKGEPVLTPLAGKVIRAGWATQGWSNYGLRVILQHDLGDGHVYHTIYCHLDAIDSGVKEGGMVSAGQLLGTLGQSCLGQLSCGSFSTPHLHWAIHRDSSVGGSGTGGSYGGNAVVPEPFDGAEDLFQGQVITSSNSSDPKCGDGFCNGDETPENCPQDCPICALIPPTGRVVEESESLCFTQFGTPKYWTKESAGHGGSLLWTTATDDAKPDNYGVWSFDFQQAGDYTLEIYTDAGFGQSKQARYQIEHDGDQDENVVDQSAVDGWQTLGTFYFAAGGGQQLRLDDNTGEPLSQKRKLAFDAVRLTGMGNSGGSGSGGNGLGGSGAMGTGGEGASAGGGGTNTGGAPSIPATPSDADSGCSCRHAGLRARRTLPTSMYLLGLALLATRRRRHPPLA